MGTQQRIAEKKLTNGMEAPFQVLIDCKDIPSTSLPQPQELWDLIAVDKGIAYKVFHVL